MHQVSGVKTIRMITLVTILIVFAAAATEAIAAGLRPGSQNDPLVTKSYVDSYLTDNLDQRDTQLKQLETRFAELERRVALIAAKANPFRDLQGHWAADSILFLRSKNVISGYKDGTFRPNTQVTRAQLAAMLVRAKGLSTGSLKNPEFTDVPTGYWAYKEIAAAKKAGIIGGFPDGTFGPDQPVTREQLAGMIARTFETKASIEGREFGDIGQSWAKEAILNLSSAGIMGGYPDNIFAPKRAATRAEISEILARAIEPSRRLKQ